MLKCRLCERHPLIHITTVSRSGELLVAQYCVECANIIVGEVYPSETKPVNLSEEVRIEVERVIISEAYDHGCIDFREIEGERRMSIQIGIVEVWGIDRMIRGEPCPRPLTHDAWLATVTALGAEVQAVCIRDLREAIYFAEVRLHRAGELVRVDVRPSDAVGLALKARAPILIPDRLLSQVVAQGRGPAPSGAITTKPDQFRPE